MGWGSEGSAVAFVLVLPLAFLSVIPAGNLLLSFLQSPNKAVILSDQREPKDLRLLFYTCSCFSVCHSRRESASAFASQFPKPKREKPESSKDPGRFASKLSAFYRTLKANGTDPPHMRIQQHMQQNPTPAWPRVNIPISIRPQLSKVKYRGELEDMQCTQTSTTLFSIPRQPATAG